MHSKRIQEKVKKDYNEIAKEFSDTRTHAWKEFESFTPYLKEKQSILDLGCGNGRLLSYLQKHGDFKYIGVDQSAGLLKHAKKNHPKAKFIEADISKKLDLKPVDLIFAIASFHHIPPADQVKTLKNWKKLLKKDGALIMTKNASGKLGSTPSAPVFLDS